MNKPLFTVRVDVVHRVAPSGPARSSRSRRQPGMSGRRNTQSKAVGAVIAELVGHQKLKLRLK